MNKESILKLVLVFSLLILFLSGSRFPAEAKKVTCIEEKCEKPHEHGQLNYHERFSVEHEDNFATVTLKSFANFWEANATGMTFAIIIGGAALSLLLSWEKFEKILQFKGIKGAALSSVFGMPLNMCANCSAITSVGITGQKGSTESTLGIIFGGALLNIIGIVTMFGLFNPAVVISRIVFSLILILFVVPYVAKMVNPQEPALVAPFELDIKSLYTPKTNWFDTLLKTLEDWLLAVGNIAYKLIPLMLIGTLFTALFRAGFSNEVLHHITTYNPYLILVIISFIGTMLSVPVLFEILLGTMLLHLGFSNGAIAVMVFTAPSYGLFTMVLTKQKLGGFKIPLLLLGTTFIFGIGAGLLADFLTKFF